MISISKLRAILGGSLLVVATLVGAFTLLAPASAQSVAKQLISLACFDNQQCIKITNTSPTGKAIVGVAQNASGIVGRTNVNRNRNPNVFPPVDTNGGVTGVDTSANLLDTNAGIYGTSKNGTGVIGLTTFDSSGNGYGQLGVLGIDNSTTANQNSGVAGTSNHNFGVSGVAFDPNTGIGVFGFETGGFGVEGDTESNTIGGIGVVGVAALGVGGGFFSSDPKLAGVDITNGGGGAIIDAFGGNGGLTEVMSLDNAGNMALAGDLQTDGTPMSITPTSAGRKVLTYAPQQSVRTVEDVGEAQLIGGQAIVRLEPTFASAMDTRSPYLVFITPQGKTSGLYVTEKTRLGFVVREYNGASSIAFDYRIVAKPYGSAAQRMPFYVEQRHAAVVAAESRMMARALSARRSHIRP